MAGGRAPRDHRARAVDPADLHSMGSRPSTAWQSATTSSATTTCTAAPGNRSLRAPRLTCSWPPARSSATARNGSGSPPVRPPTRALALPRRVGALIGTDPRIIADDVWAKLRHAGLNIEAADLPGTSAGSYYRMKLIRALTLTWLFSGLRSDEISRLRAGCTTGCPFPVTRARSSPPTPSACSTYQSTRPAPRSPSPSTRSSGRPSKPGSPCGPPSPRGWTARPASTSACSSPSARTRSARPTSTARSSRRYAPEPASRPPMSAATSPATGSAPPSPASSTTPKSR